MMDLKTRCLSTNTCYGRIQKRKCTDYVHSWKSKGVYNFKRILLILNYILLSSNTKLSGYRIEIKFDKDALVTE